MNAKWPKVNLAEVLRYRKNFITIDDLAAYKRPRVQLHAQGIVLRDEIPGALIKTKQQQVCRSGEFLVAEIDAKVGGFGIVPKSLGGAIVSSHYFLYVLDDSKLDRKFLDYFSRTPAFSDQIAAQGSTNYAAIRPGDVLSYEIPLPPLDEQRRIVARIEELAAQINEARALRHQGAKETDALGSAARNLFFISAGKRFALSSLEELSSRITKGESPEWQGYTYQDDGPLFIRSENVLWGALDPRNAVHIPEAFHEKLSRSQLCEGDVLINLVGASIGRPCAVPAGLGSANVNQAVGVIRPRPDRLFPGFLVHFLLSSVTQDEIHAGKVETARPNISLGDLRDLQIPTPPLPEQQSIVVELNSLQAELERLKRIQFKTASEIDALLPSILDKAFKGWL
jgi:type I restriction enzyme S subunit